VRVDLSRRRIPGRARVVIALSFALALPACGDRLTETAGTPGPVTPAPSPSDGGAMTRTEGEDLRSRLNTTDLTIKIDSEPARVRPGERSVYTITVANQGPNPSTSTLVSAGTTGAAWVDFPNSCRSSGPQRLLCELGELGARTPRTLVLTAQAETAEGAVSVTGTVENRQGPDSNGRDNTATTTTPVGD
jgi:hypothetical protein